MSAAGNARMQVAILPGGRLHLNDGPIDLVIAADGEAAQVRAAYAAATHRFATVLDELCAELPLLRSPVTPDVAPPECSVAQRMDIAARRVCHDRFITRMAAVAGAVADEIVATMVNSARLARACVNNGGDIALHLAEGQSYVVGLVDRPDVPALFGDARIGWKDHVRGIATSGWRGRSFSLGIADAATVLAQDAASADAAATLIANAINLPDHPAIARVKACDLDPKSDLGDMLVTRGVGALSPSDVALALARGAEEAQRLVVAGLVEEAALHLSGASVVVGAMPKLQPGTRERAQGQRT